jgi:hypothetical protein
MTSAISWMLILEAKRRVWVYQPNNFFMAYILIVGFLSILLGFVLSITINTEVNLEIKQIIVWGLVMGGIITICVDTFYSIKPSKPEVKK